jgi:integrase/recombinase XerD
MRKHNVENEIAKREYLAWLKNPGGLNEATVDQVAAAIHAYEAHTQYASFKTFRPEKAVAFQDHLAAQTNEKTGKPLSKSTLHSRLRTLRAFFEWLSREPGYRKLRFNHAACFSLNAKDIRVATASRQRPTPSLDQVIHVLQSMPTETLINRRDRAVLAFAILAGARDSAIASMRLKHVDLAARWVFQDARDVKTKAAKTIDTGFFAVGDLPVDIVTDWIGELQRDLFFGPDDPLFPSTIQGLDANGLFTPTGLSREGWASPAPIRAIFKRAFLGAGLQYFTPHSLRRTLQYRSYELGLNERQRMAWSQSLGHASPYTGFASYGRLPVNEQLQVMRDLAQPPDPDVKRMAAIAEELASLARRQGA